MTDDPEPDGKRITLFMWGWQEHFRIAVQHRAEGVLGAVGLTCDPVVLLVGVRRDGVKDVWPICIEPEKARWVPAMLGDLDAAIARKKAEHPDANLFHTHPRVQAQIPERIRRQAIGEAVREALDAIDRDVVTVCSAAITVDKHDVVCAVQIPATALAAYPTIPHRLIRGDTIQTSFARCCLDAIVGEAARALGFPDPNGETMREAREIVVGAAEAFMRVSAIAGRYVMRDMFQTLSSLSQLKYEGERGSGRLAVAAGDDPRLRYITRFAEPVPLGQTRWIRKLLQMSTRETPLIADYEHAFGLAQVADGGPPLFHADFADQHEWLYKVGDTTLLHCRFGEPSLPKDAVDPIRFADTLRRLFPEMSDNALVVNQTTLLEMTRQPHGSMIVIARDAADEAARLEAQGTRIAPTRLTPDMLNHASRIDGTILVDPEGMVHAIGVILDGDAHALCTPSRGARYNSGIRYVAAANEPRVALVMSEDRTLDVIPLLRPRMSRTAIEAAVAELEHATPDDYHVPRNRLSDIQFYLDQPQCDRINARLKAFDAIPLREHEFRILNPHFEPNPAMSDEYLTD